MAHRESVPEFQQYLVAFREGLQKLGWVEGRNIAIDTRWGALDDADVRQRSAKEILALNPDIIHNQHWLVRFTPRKSRSKWSALNRNRALTLIKEGRMRPAGIAQIEAAKADGRWEGAYAPASRAKVPIDLQKSLDNNPKASAFLATVNSRNRYAILYRIGNVKKAETRARKIAEFVAMLERGETIHG